MTRSSFHSHGCLARVAVAALAIIGAPVSPVSAQTSGSPVSAQTSGVVGFLQSSVPAAINGGAMPAVSVLSMPFRPAPDFTGNITTVNGTAVISDSGANWADAQWTTTPHLVHFQTGPSEGRHFLILRNTATQLTVDARGLDLKDGLLAAGDRYIIFPATTLDSLFGTGTKVPFQTGASAGQADNVAIWNGAKWTTYYPDGTSWRKGNSTANCDRTVILPDAGLLITRRAASPLTLVLAGRVPDTDERSDVPGPASTFLANRFPVNTTLGALGLQSLPEWRSAADTANADTVLLSKNGTWITYFFDGATWRRADKPAADAGAKTIKAGSAVFVVRQSPAAVSAATLTQPLPYRLD